MVVSGFGARQGKARRPGLQRGRRLAHRNGADQIAHGHRDRARAGKPGVGGDVEDDRAVARSGSAPRDGHPSPIDDGRPGGGRLHRKRQSGRLGFRHLDGRGIQRKILDFLGERPGNDFRALVVGMKSVGNEQAAPRPESLIDVGEQNALVRGITSQVTVERPHPGHQIGPRPDFGRDRADDGDGAVSANPPGCFYNRFRRILKVMARMVAGIVGAVEDQHVGRGILDQPAIDVTQPVGRPHSADAGVDGEHARVVGQTRRVRNIDAISLGDAVAGAQHPDLGADRWGRASRPQQTNQDHLGPLHFHCHSCGTGNTAGPMPNLIGQL